MVGFSRLTGSDEEGTLARLRALRSDLIDPIIAVHNGRVVMQKSAHICGPNASISPLLTFSTCRMKS
jgi:hypothetical protein